MNTLIKVQILVLCILLGSCNTSNRLQPESPIAKTDISLGLIESTDVTFSSEGVNLAGTIYQPKRPSAGVVIVHGSDQVPRMTKLGTQLAKNGIAVLTYDKRGVGASEGEYAGPEVGTNNISNENLSLLAKDANAAVETLRSHIDNIPIGLLGASQAGWIIPIAASNNASIEFMVLFSCPTITTLEQLRFQFYTNGDNDFWKKHTQEDARAHTFNDPDKYQFEETDPKTTLSKLSIPGLWLFGEQDIQIPVKICMGYLNDFKVQGKPFEYVLFPSLGHNTTSTNTTVPIDIAIQWMKQQSIVIEKKD